MSALFSNFLRSFSLTEYLLHSADWRFYYVFAFSTFYEYPTFLIITFFCFTFYIRLLFSKKFFSDHDFVMKKPQKFKCKCTCTQSLFWMFWILFIYLWSHFSVSPIKKEYILVFNYQIRKMLERNKKAN